MTFRCFTVKIIISSVKFSFSSAVITIVSNEYFGKRSIISRERTTVDNVRFVRVRKIVNATYALRSRRSKIMKFRGRMSDFVAMRDFTNIISVVSRIAKQCVLRLTPDVLYFNVADDRVSMVWAELSQSHFFNEYVMKGVTDDQNEIYLEIESVMLAKSLASFRMTAKSVKLKLTNKQQPCLTFEIELPSLTTEARHCIHDIPVRVLPRREWVDYQAPSVPDFDVSIDMPQLKQVRNVVERMRNLSPTITLMADKTGMLVLKINTSCATVATHFQGLQGWQSSQMTEEEETVSATVDVKKFSMFLAWEAVHPEAVKCNILQDKMINLFLSIADYLKIHYFIPATVT